MDILWTYIYVVGTETVKIDFSFLNVERCVDRDGNCNLWKGFCTTDPYVRANCLLTCDDTCPEVGESKLFYALQHSFRVHFY